MNIIFKDEHNMKKSKLKTKILICSNETARLDTKLEGDTLGIVEEYKNLGSMVTSNERYSQEMM